MSFSAATKAKIAHNVEPMKYRSMPSARRDDSGKKAGQATQESSRIPVDELAARVEKARMEGRIAAQSESQQELANLRAGIQRALQEFAGQKERYFEQVEAEIVQLALSIAAKILQREAILDPLILQGLVRLALERLDDATEMRIRVPPCDAPDWRSYLTENMPAPQMPQVLEDESVVPNDCVLETSMGSTHLGLEAQLKEIETTLFDLMARKPGSPHV